MVEISELVAILRALGDPEVADVVRRATEGRPGLAAVHEAALGATSDIPATPDILVTPDIPAAPAVPPHPDLSTAPRDVPPPPVVGSVGGHPDPGYTATGVPTFDSVRDKIESRGGTAIGGAELARESAPGRTVEEQWEAREKAGHDRLEAIRKSMKSEGQ